MDKREKKGLALGAIVGAVVGVITGILFAPKSGKETRQDIKEATSKAAEKLSAEAHKIQEEAVELIAKAEVRLKLQEEIVFAPEDTENKSLYFSELLKDFNKSEILFSILLVFSNYYKDNLFLHSSSPSTCII